MGRVAAAIAPLGERARGHLVERGGDGVALGVAVVPRRRTAERQHRVEIADRAGADIFRGRGREREVEEDELEHVLAAGEPDGDVVGLDVAVRHALLFEVTDDVDQVFAEPLEQVDVEAAFLADAAAERLDAIVVEVGEHRPHEEARVVADLHRLLEGDNAMVSVVGERLEGSRLGPHTIVVLRRGGDLENELFARPVIGAPAGDEQGRRAGALADPTLDLETAGEDVAGDGLGGVLGIFLYGARELVFGVVEERKEVGDRVEAVGDVGVGGVLDQFAERLVGTVEDCRQQ